MDTPSKDPGRWSSQVNRAAHEAAQRIDDTTGESAQRAAVVITSAVRLMRWPTAALLWLSGPFIIATIMIGWAADGSMGWVILGLGLLMAAVAGAFAVRRNRVLHAVADPEVLAAELRVMVNLTGRTQQAGAVFRDITGGDGWRVLGRLRGLWRGATLPATWVQQVGELPRARYFAPPKIGTTVTLSVAAAWLVPISIVVAALSAIGALAGSI
ncbi:MAG: hypothetical protein WB508_08965 [Aeromicrobium sp.]|uniref:hypothetical protein n=1 Tax=Aeromicrobium sp. TaxID=1871063 RepID=UPI003C57D5C5